MAGVVRIRRGLIAAAVAVAMLGFAAPALALPRYVSTTGTDTANDCSDSANPCLTIQHAIDQAVSGDAVNVAAGTYPAPVDVNQPVHLLGAQAGVDARTRDPNSTTNESIVQQGFTVEASGASIDGFFDDNGPTTSPGITLSSAASGYRIVNNIIRGYSVGIDLGSNGNNQTLIRHNSFISNTAAGVPSDRAVSASSPQATVSNVSIDANASQGHMGNFMVLSPGYGQDVAITGNSSTGEGPLELHNINGGSIAGNSISNRSGAPGIDLTGGVTDFSITGNDVSGGSDGVDIENASGTNPNRAISLIGNDLHDHSAFGVELVPGAMSGNLTAHFNRFVKNASAAIYNADTPVDATNNWWGCNNGPNQTGCDKTTGAGTVNSAPYLVLTATAERGRILTNGDTNRVTGGFGFNSAAQAVDPSAFPPTLLAFTASLGTVSPVFAKTNGGVAQTLYTAGSTAGNGSVTAHADQAQATTSPFVVSSEAGPQGPQGPPGSAAQPNPVLILSNSLRATKQHIVSVSISCPVAAGLCDGRLGIGAGSATLGNVSFLVQGGSKAVIRVRFTKSGVRRAIRRKKVTVVVLSRDNAGTAALTTKVVQFRK